jgi:hypothetical protein
MTKPVAAGFLCFCVTMAVLIGQRLSGQAMAVIVGSVIGVVSSVPMTALILWILVRQRDGAPNLAAPARRDNPPVDEPPRMIVIQPQAYGGPGARYPQVGEPSRLDMSGWQVARPARDFTIVGEEDFEDEDRNALV